MLYSAMEDFYIDIVVGEGPTAHPVHFPLPPFTLIGATTRAGLLAAPLRDRFGIVARMDYYTTTELSQIIDRSATIFNTKIQEDGAHELALRSRGTPRIANRLLKRVRDFAQVGGQAAIDPATVDRALDLLAVDDQGLDEIDRKLLTTMIEHYHGGPVGDPDDCRQHWRRGQHDRRDVRTLPPSDRLFDAYPRGRVVTPAAYEHLKIPFDQEEN